MTLDPEVSKAINELIVLVLSSLTTVVIPYLIVLARSYAKAKIAAAKDKNMREALEFALDRLDQTAQTVVTEVEQTRQNLAADGKLSQEDARLLLRTAYTRIKQRIPQDAMDTLQKAFGDRLQGVVVGKIESKVAAL